MEAALNAFNITQRMYRIAEVHLFFTDYPHRDRRFFSLHIPSLGDAQQELDAGTRFLRRAVYPDADYNPDSVTVTSSVPRMNCLSCAMRSSICSHRPANTLWRVALWSATLSKLSSVTLQSLTFDHPGQSLVLRLPHHRFYSLPIIQVPMWSILA